MSNKEAKKSAKKSFEALFREGNYPQAFIVASKYPFLKRHLTYKKLQNHFFSLLKIATLYIKQGQVIYNADIEQAMQSGIEHMPIASAIIFNDRQHIIYADDVSISLQQQQNSSIRHQIAAQIIAIKPQEAFVLLELELDLTNQKQKLMAKITQQSLQKLALKPQQKVFANFKASAYQTKI